MTCSGAHHTHSDHTIISLCTVLTITTDKATSLQSLLCSCAQQYAVSARSRDADNAQRGLEVHYFLYCSFWKNHVFILKVQCICIAHLEKKFICLRLEVCKVQDTRNLDHLHDQCVTDHFFYFKIKPTFICPPLLNYNFNVKTVSAKASVLVTVKSYQAARSANSIFDLSGH